MKVDMKPAAFKATPQLSPEASRELLRRIGAVRLSDKRRQELADLAVAARTAFSRPLPSSANGH